jgi:quercetin dioxygenase-like cupin family protein
MIDLLKLESFVKESNINLTEQDILNFLQIRHRWPFRYFNDFPSVEILTNNVRLESSLFFDIDRYLNYEKWKHYYDLGFTTIISNAMDLTKELRELNKKLTEHTGLKIHMNMYFSKPGQIPSFPYHKHPYDVIVKQIYGKGEWKLDGQYFTLKPNDTCIIPKNVYHEVYSKNENKLSLTINIQ